MKRVLIRHLWKTHMFQTGPLQVRSELLVSRLFSTVFPRSHYSPLLYLIPFLSTSHFQPLPLFFFCSRHNPLLSHISSHNSSAKTSLNLTPHMWVHTAKNRNNTEILQIRSCQINGGISGAHPSLWRGQLEACSRPNLHVKIHSVIQTVD